MDIRIRIIARGGEEPRLNRATRAHPLDPPAALRQPYIAKAAPEQPPLPRPGRLDPKSTQALVDDVGVDALAVIGAAKLVPPAEQRRRAQRTHPRPPLGQELRLRRPDCEHDTTRRTAGRSDRRVGVRHELGDDLDEIDATLREVLTEVPAADATDVNGRGIKRCDGGHETKVSRIPRTESSTLLFPIRPAPSLASPSMSEPADSLRVANSELVTVREAMRELNKMLAALEAGEIEKIVLTQRNQMRAVLVTLERYSQLEQSAA